jgi:23S rRNA (cytidine1920-2'-O)/16S rRNA (cytidine1409-2'-O)-methyltransferase
MIMAGLVHDASRKLDKPGQLLPEDAEISVQGREHPWVSRGGMKLAHALEHFGFSAEGKVGLDIGASTGGFTDVLLQAGAGRIYAVDVGHGQLDWKIRQNPNVVVMEKTNARYLTAEQIAEPLDMVVCDASFISLKTVLPAALALTRPGCWMVALIKPQFEAGREHVGKGGVVRDPAIHQAVCDGMVAWMASLYPEWSLQPVIASPILGPEGNREFLLGAVKN